MHTKHALNHALWFHDNKAYGYHATQSSHKDVLILKTITQPDTSEFNTLVTKARRKATELGMTKAALDEATKKVRK